MDYMQESKNDLSNKFKSRFLTGLLALNFVALIITFLLNFLGLPILKYHYLTHVAITAIAILYFEFSQIFPIIITYSFLEGQGRILWEYQAWARISFDILILASIIKIFITKKKVLDLNKIPLPLVLLISAHFLWYGVEFFNIYSISYFSVLAATKVYIYPIFLFFGLVQTDFDPNNFKFQKHLNFLFLLITLELILTFFQFSAKENLLLQISPYYNKAMEFGRFSGIYFRPFSTTQAPGTITVFLFLTVGFLYLKKPSKLGSILNLILVSASGLAIILCQVRSVFIKLFLIVILIQLGEIIYFRFKTKKTFAFIIIPFVLFFGFKFISNNQTSTGDISIDFTRDRISTLGDIDKIKNARLSINEFIKIITQKLNDNPFGIGPGLTGPVASVSEDELAGNRFIKKNMTWAFDNLIVSLVIDFGIGAIFYILLLIYIPVYFVRFLFIYYQNKLYESYKILLICFCCITVIIFGNWGAVAITYNPESFIFWFFSAMGFSTISKQKLTSN